MKNILTLVTTLLVSLTQLHAQAPKLDALQVVRYTRQGTDVLVESGYLVASTKKFESAGAQLYPESSLNLPASSITAISGKFTADKPTIDTNNRLNPGYLDNYSFSKKAYATVLGQSYIVTLASGGNASAPSASLKVSNKKLTEGKKTVCKLIVNLNKATKSDIVVRYKLSGSAKENSDYQVTGSEGIVKIKKGKKSGFSTIKVINDKAKESTEKISIQMLAGSEYKLGKAKKATVKILDND